LNISIGPSGFGVSIGASMAPASAMPSHSLVSVRQSRSAPMHAIQGYQNDGAGAVACAVAHTSHGDIPAKAKDGQCWYPYGGKEVNTNNFSWVIAPRGTHLEQNQGYPPSSAIAAGFQNDGAGQVYCAIANAPQGRIPGKALGGNCWYAYAGQEHQTSNFQWVCYN
jgi:hypothetical protein